MKEYEGKLAREAVLLLGAPILDVSLTYFAASGVKNTGAAERSLFCNVAHFQKTQLGSCSQLVTFKFIQ